MSKHIEKTLVLLKPDAVERSLAGRIIGRLEDAGFKIIAMKMVKADAELAKTHYHDVGERHGQQILDYNVNFLTSGPVIAIVIEGVNAIENIRKFCGTTEPKASPPGTIRGDYAHVSYAYSDEQAQVAKNIIHASADAADAEREVKVWFDESEIVEYSICHERHTR